jgi:hypothetical protein
MRCFSTSATKSAGVNRASADLAKWGLAERKFSGRLQNGHATTALARLGSAKQPGRPRSQNDYVKSPAHVKTALAQHCQSFFAKRKTNSQHSNLCPQAFTLVHSLILTASPLTVRWMLRTFAWTYLVETECPSRRFEGA